MHRHTLLWIEHIGNRVSHIQVLAVGRYAALGTRANLGVTAFLPHYVILSSFSGR